ncbi:MAG: hypothetical protein ACRC62_36675 [Microcoleus sp.]
MLNEKGHEPRMQRIAAEIAKANAQTQRLIDMEAGNAFDQLRLEQQYRAVAAAVQQQQR